MGEVCSVLIVGGGPAGASCAFELAKTNRDVIVCDHSHPREKPCGGAVSPYVFEKFPFLKRFQSEDGTPTKFRIMTSEDRQIRTNVSETGFNISRQVFDQEILNMAVSIGARLRREKVLDVEKRSRFWKVKTTSGILSTKVLVGADGVNSLVRRKTLGPISGKNLALAYGYMATGFEKTYSIIKYLGAIQGYAWFFPRKNDASVGIWSVLEHGSKLKHLLDDFINSYCPNIDIISKFCAMVPSAREQEFFRLPCAGKNWVLIGDAAGHVDPITGEGILYALWSGKLAAEAIMRNDVKFYDRLWRKQYGKSFRDRTIVKGTLYDNLTVELSAILNSFYSKP